MRMKGIPIRNLYARLGFLRQPDWLQMEMRLTASASLLQGRGPQVEAAIKAVQN